MEKEMGVVSHYFDKIGVAAIRLSSKLKVGNKIRIKGGEMEFEQTIKSMQLNREEIEQAKAGDEVGIKVEQKANKGDKVYKIEN